LKNAIAKEVKEEILAKVKAGETVSSLSKQYGVSDKAIYNWLRGGAANRVSRFHQAYLESKDYLSGNIHGLVYQRNSWL